MISTIVLYLDVLDLGEPSAWLLGPDLDVVGLDLREPSAWLLGPNLDVVGLDLGTPMA